MRFGKHEVRRAVAAWTRKYLWITCLALCPTVLSGEAMTGEIDGYAVTISGARAGSTLLLVSMSREWTPAGVRVTRSEERVSDADGDGTIRHEPSQTILVDSLWIALDPTTGDSVVLVPKEGRLREATLPSGSLRQDSGAGTALLMVRDFSELALYAARPGAGVFHATASDGGNLDADLENNAEIQADLTRLLPVEGSGDSLGTLRGNELLFGIDPRTLTLVTVAPAATEGLGGGR